MKLNEKKFFELAKEHGFEAADLSINRDYALSCEIFHKEVSSLTTSDSYSCVARGIINEKFGSVVTEVFDKDTPEYLISSIEKTAKLVEKDEKALIFEGSKKYHKKNVFNPNVLGKPTKEIVNTLLEIESKLLAYSPKINEVASVAYEESCSEERLVNSYGLNLKSKKAVYVYVAEVTAKEGDEVKTGFNFFESMDPNEFNIDEFVKEVAEDALKKLGSTQCISKKYPTILNQECAAVLLKAYLSGIDAEEVQKHSSLLEGKLNEQVASKKLTVIEDPLKKNLFFTYFDDEGVATYKKHILTKGVLNTYLYTLETAKKAGVEPTGNGYRSVSKAHASLINTIVKPGKKTLEQIMLPIKEGVYITDLQGLHAGLNAQSGNFSLQAQGFMIRDGKLAEPLSLITVAGNLKDLFMDVKEVANDSKLIYRSSCYCPSFLIKKLSISGK